EDGPKNPLKGTSMKLLVAAFYAQFRVAAGRLGLRANRNGIWSSTRFPWRLPFVVKLPIYRKETTAGRLNLLRGANFTTLWIE
ncbi:MAG: hypothetical protein ACI3XF_03925, partial [Eubacteriales bacterium]